MFNQSRDIVEVDWASRLPIVAHGRYAPEDFRKLRWLLSLHFRSLWWGYVLGAIAGALMLGYRLVTAENPSERSSAIFTLGLLAAAVVLIIVFIVVVPRRRELAEWEASRPPYDLRTLVFDNNGVTSKTEQAESTVKWNAFVDFKATPEFLALIVQKDIECIVIPKRFFRSGEDWSSLLAATAAKILSRG